MRVVLVVALAGALAGPAVGQSGGLPRQQAVLAGEVAYIFGGCERYFPKEQADNLVSLIAMDDEKPKTNSDRARGQLYSEMYAKGRKDPQLAEMGENQCLGLINDVTEELRAVNAKIKASEKASSRKP